MRIDIMTLFPEALDAFMSESIIGRARQSGKVQMHFHNIRDYSQDKHRRVDDTPYGGGMGMLMAAPPIYNCYNAICSRMPEDIKRRVVYMSPGGKTLDHEKVKQLSEYENLIILCGHYEGVDERIIQTIVDEEISIGDYVLTGGELPACVLADCVCRLLPGVLSDKECYEDESFASGLLEYPQYTRPYEFLGMKVPDVLISGNHAKIAEFRYKASYEKTLKVRPDLIQQLNEKKEDDQ
ncbi:MAG: tRNA (guanosine(37)-N1)-methyltransferase TrmD [Clostridia bacterium]|nr:tRNA (guanosine(37)-N1)-methyltransferase TrmD [Clostridia bacterium]